MTTGNETAINAKGCRSNDTYRILGHGFKEIHEWGDPTRDGVSTKINRTVDFCRIFMLNIFERGLIMAGKSMQIIVFY